MIKSRLVIPRRWRCLLCGRTLVSSYPAFCTDHSTLDFPANCTAENMVRLCGYSQCDVPAMRRLTCGDQHDVLAAREALRWTVIPSAEQKGDWLYRERIRCGFSRSRLSGLLRVHWNYLFHTEVKDLWLPAEWIELVHRALEIQTDHKGGNQ